jgi:hypothetical protein
MLLSAEKERMQRIADAAPRRYSAALTGHEQKKHPA